eukprot:TRINITY_DN9649_c0_g1_i1.p1 TRINITY_DN9649_c0_g1~~TRINITY_DN9649_c0_g1_i1.p1  ORF type:complete len:1030 (+),score=394.99 TRINITY_DN9649_c0_g1_i1:45-3134(+)
MSTLLKPDEVDKIRDWAAADYKKRMKNWDGTVPIWHLVKQLHLVLEARENRKEKGKVSKMSPEEVKRRIESIEADLSKTDTGYREKNEHVVLEDVLRYYSTDPKTRFDIQFVKERQLEAEDSLGLWMYIPFIILFSFFLVEGKGLGNGYWMNSGLLDQFLDEEFAQSDALRYKKTFYDIGSIDELWEFVEGPLISGLWSGDGDDIDVRANNFVQGSNMPIGALKVRQLRVDAHSCGKSWDNLRKHKASQLSVDTIISRLNDFNVYCYPEYNYLDSYNPHTYEVISLIHDGNQMLDEEQRCASDKTCKKSPFPITYSYRVPFNESTVHPDDLIALEAFKHRTCSQLNGSETALFTGEANVYGCDGYAQIIPFNWNLAQVKAAVAVLRDGIRTTNYNNMTQTTETTQIPWVDKQTRSISFELFFYNQNIELISRYIYFVELTAGGAWNPVHGSVSFKLFSWENRNWVYFLFNFLYFIWVMGYVMVWFRFVGQETFTARAHLLQSNNDTLQLWFVAWAEAVWDFWIWFDFINLSLLVAAWGIRFKIIDMGLTSNNLLQNLYYPPDYEKVAYLGMFAVDLNAISAIFVYMRSFYFLKLNPRLNLLTRTVGQARDEIIAILLIFMFVFVAFALMCYVVYGHVDENYRTFGQSTISLMLMLLGDFNYVALREEHRVFTPIFFALFEILTVFLLFNMVVAVLADAFNEVQNTKYRDRKLVDTLVKNQLDRWQPEKNPKKNKPWSVPSQIMRNSLIVESIYWWKLIVVSVKKIVFRTPEEEYNEERARITDSNPRTYWAKFERSFYNTKRCTNFVDNLQLTPRELDDYLEEALGKDKEYFLYDKESGVEGMILQSAKETHVTPQELVEEMMEFHHEWFKEVSQKTTTGNTEDRKAMREQRHADRQPSRKDEIDELFDAKFAINPQKRWEEQRAKLDSLKYQVLKISQTGGAAKDKCTPCGTKKVEVMHTLESKITEEVEVHIDELICQKINEIVDKLMTQDMPSWISDLVTTAEEEAIKAGPDHTPTPRSSIANEPM